MAMMLTIFSKSARKIKQVHELKRMFCVYRSESATTDDSAKFADCPTCVFSGIQPTGVPHLGNYLCAIKKWVDLQKQYDRMLVSIVDLHSITVPQDPDILRENILVMAACLMACGIDHERTILFQQSTEKSKVVNDPGLGLYTYPILQSADILLYKATLVPVGEDQLTHLELCQDLARTFNRMFANIFPYSKPLIGDVSKVKCLRDPTCKMSKSSPNHMSRIDLQDSADLIRAKIKKSTTDSVSRMLSYDQLNRPGVANLINIHSLITNTKPEDIVREYENLNKVQYKEKLSEVINETVQPINKEMTRLLNDKNYIHTVLKNGSNRALEIAEKNMKEIKQLVGLR